MKLKIDLFKHALLLMGLVMMGNFAMAQRTITGTVTDAETKEPLIGASVVVDGTTTGAITDFDGKYSLDVPEGATALKFSYTGYTTTTQEIGASNVIDMALSAGAVLEEVVVVGYGTRKAKEVTSAITSVKAEDFNQGNVADPAQLLQGKVAGLSIARPGGDPNQGFNIRLRGLSTIGANTQPLIVIDGVPGASLNSVDPNDIASIDVLKDGSAAAIYGTRGASGVILITTKRGEPGETSVSYNGFVAVESVDRTVPVFSATDYKNFEGSTDLGSETDWFEELTRDAVTQVHNTSLAGGTEKTSYRISFNLRDGQGVALNTDYTFLNGRINLEQRALNDRLKLTMNLASTLRRANFGFSDAFRYATIYNPTAPVFSDNPNDENGGYFQQDLFDYFNPVAILEQNFNEGQQRRIVMNLRADYELIDGLTASVFYALQRENDEVNTYYDKNSFWIGAGRNGLAERRNDERDSELLEITANYNFEVNPELEISVLGAYSYQEFVNNGFSASGGDFVTNAFTFNNFAGASDFANGLGSVNSYKNSNKLVAFFGRVNVNYEDTYYLTASLRREGSTKFGDNNKWGWFYGVSGGVTLSNLFDVQGVDNLKLRVGYGVTGNPPNDSYLSLLRFAPLVDDDGNSIFALFNGGYIPAYGPASNPNPDLQWETKSDISVGLDFSLLDYKLNGALDFYSTTTKDLLLDFPVDASTNLFPTKIVNIGELRNSGLELALDYQAIDKSDFSWAPGIALTYFLETKLITLSDPESGLDFGGFRDIANLGAPGQNQTPLVRVEEDADIGQLWGLVYEGIDEDGEWIFADVNGDGNPGQNDDRQVIGNGLPTFQLGFNNSFTYKNFDFNIFFRGVFGHDLVNTFRAFYEAPSAIVSYNVLESTEDVANLTAGAKFSDLHVENASFVKLDNMTIGYTFDLPENSSFTKIRLYATGQNLLTITNYKGVDPEVRFTDSEGGALAPGIDRRNTWFRTRTIAFGVNLGF